MFITIKNKNGHQITLNTLGARMISWLVPTQSLGTIDIIQGFDQEEEYALKGKSQGAICGRYANRIANAQFRLNGKVYNLPKNDGNNCLHSGNKELRLAYYKIKKSTDNEVVFEYDSPNLENGFPGNVHVEIGYLLTDKNEVKISLFAQSDEETPINLTSHAYFNLNGAGSGPIFNHYLQIPSAQVLEVNYEAIPTGNILDGSQTAFDFKDARPFGDIAKIDNAQITPFKGYDHCYVLQNAIPTELLHHATLQSKESGLQLSVYSDQPGMQLYTVNALNTTGKQGQHYGDYSAVCLEPQFFPNCPNQPEFPFANTKPNHDYQRQIIYKIEQQPS